MSRTSPVPEKGPEQGLEKGPDEVPVPAPLPSLAAHGTRAELLANQHAVLRAIDRRAWGVRRMGTAALRMLAAMFALFLVLQATGGGTAQELVAVVVVVLVVAGALLWWSVPGLWRTLRVARLDAAAAQAWRDVVRGADARALPPGDPDASGTPSTAWDRRDSDDLDEVATRRVLEAGAAIRELAPRGHLLLTVPLTLGLVGSIAAVFPEQSLGVRLGGLAAAVTCLLPATVLTGLTWRESYRRQREANAQWREGEVLRARRAVLADRLPEPAPPAPGPGGRRVYVVVFVGLLALLLVQVRTASTAALVTIAGLLAVAVPLVWIGLECRRWTRVQAFDTGPADRLGVGRARRVEVERSAAGDVHLRPHDADVPAVTLPAATIRGVVPVELPGAFAPPGVVVVTDEGVGGAPHGLWLLSGRAALVALTTQIAAPA